VAAKAEQGALRPKAHRLRKFAQSERIQALWIGASGPLKSRLDHAAIMIMAVQPASLEVLEKAAVPAAQARAIVQAIEIEIAGARDTLATKQDILILRQETKQDMLSLRHEMAELRAELRQDMAGLRTELRQEMTDLRTELRQEMTDLRHGLELKIASAVTQPQLYAALLGQMALLLGIAYFFVTHLQH
jgi:hypothetical protein